MVATGSVTMKYKDIESFSDKAVILADPKGGLQKIDLIGNAKVKQEQNTSEGHHFVYNPITEEMSVSGNTKTIAISDDGKKLTIHSDYQQYNKKQNSYIGNGHVKIWFDDYYAQGPKVSVFPDEKTGKPNEVYFVGRSKIVQADKDIIADKIRMTMDPKDFQAEGNVRTIIHNIDTKDGDL
jgi:lipopolysaccharide export system protein LptA